MWQRGLNWAAIALVGLFGLMWVGVVVYADQDSSPPMRTVQIVFGLVLFAWALRKALR